MDGGARIGGEPLLVRIEAAAPFVAGIWSGAGVADAEPTARQAAESLLAWPAETLVLDLGDLDRAGPAVTAPLVELIREWHRLGRRVCLVRCHDDLFRDLQEGGATGALSHAPSLSAATDGRLGRGAKMLELHLRSMPELLSRLRQVVTLVASQAGLPEPTQGLLRAAVDEAAANAIMHGSPEGPRNHVRIAFHLDRGALTVDVSDQGPGFDPGLLPVPPPEELLDHGYGLRMIGRAMDRVEYFRGDRGMLVRMTKFVEHGALAR